MASDVVGLARELVALDTVNPPGREAAAARLLAGRLERAGLQVDLHAMAADRASLVARWLGRRDAPALAFVGHLDTVPLGEAPWSVAPYGGEVDGDRLYGRGSSDMKGAVAAMVVAAERLAAAGRGEAGVTLILVAAEETGCEGSRALAATATALGEVGAMVVGEPTANLPHVGHKGVAWIEAETVGRAAHGSMPHLGRNALYPLARAIAAWEGHVVGQPHPLFGAPSLSVGWAAGGVGVNTVPDRARAMLDVRTVPGITGADVLAGLRHRAGDDAVALRLVLDLPAVLSDRDDPWIRDVHAVMGSPADGLRGLPYFTDAAALIAACGAAPVAILGPGDPQQAHRTDEYCQVSAIERAADAYLELATRWCSAVAPRRDASGR